MLQVQEIIRHQQSTRVPQVPACLLGVINLRGKVVPVMDIRTRFGMPMIDQTRETCIIVIEWHQPGAPPNLTGLMVDQVNDVQQIAAEFIEPPPEGGHSGGGQEAIVALARLKDKVLALIDPSRLFPEASGDGQRTLHNGFC